MNGYLRRLIQSKTDEASYMRITTITIVASFNRTLDIPAIKTTFRENIINIKGFLWTVKENKFFNQVTIEHRNTYSKKSIKLFPNGSIHITGCSDLDDSSLVLKQICALMKQIFNDQDFTIPTYRVVMINSNFVMKYTLNLSTVIQVMKETGNKVSFNPETYSAVKIKTDKATISIFCSGSIIITGAQSLDDIIDTYVMLMNVLPPCKLATIANQKTDQFQYFQGLHLDSWKAHLFSQSTVNVN